MEIFQNVLDKFIEKRPKLSWFAIRLFMIVLVVNLFVYGFGSLILAIYPFIAMFTEIGLIYYLLWFLLPMPLFAVWILFELAKMVYDEYINIK